MFQQLRNFLGRPESPDPVAVEWHQRNRLTPDIWKLEQSMFQLIFVPDDLGRGARHNELITSAARDGDVPVHPACFTMERFTYWKKDLGVESFGIPLAKEYIPSGWVRVAPSPAKIRGQLYAILSPQMKVLDIHRQNTLHFRRIRTPIHLPYSHVKYSKENPLPKISPEYIQTIEAWMYVGITDYWDDRISDLFGISEVDQFELNEPKYWLDKYYKF